MESDKSALDLFSKFYEKSKDKRIDIISKFAGLSEEEAQILRELHASDISFDQVDRMVENAIGTISFPLGVATNFVINGREYVIPMSIEEPSVIAACSKAAKIARSMGGFTMESDESYSIGQIQIVEFKDDYQYIYNKILDSSQKIIDIANSQSKTLNQMGKGAKEVHCKRISNKYGPMIIVELVVDVSDAMGANITNTMCEAVAPLLEEISGGRTILRILSNYSTRRMIRGHAVFDKELIGGEKVVDDILWAYQFALNDPYRAVTHNKGVMNGVVAVAQATGQDTRAIEAAAHAFASRNGQYSSLTRWEKDENGNLVGKIELPMSVGLVGGVIGAHPLIKICIKILAAKTAKELACVIGAVGIAQNFAAMRALATEGIQKGHMKLHARNVAAGVGATGAKIDTVANKMIQEGNVSSSRAKELLEG